MGDSNANSREVPVVALYKQSGVSVESWVEMSAQVPMRYETDPENDRTTLYFGQYDDYVLALNSKNLKQMVALATQAIADMDAGNRQR
jgi:hypothetical protein